MTIRLYFQNATLIADYDGWYVVHMTLTGDVFIASNKQELEQNLGTQRQGLRLEAPGPFSFWWRGEMWIVADGTSLEPQQPSGTFAMVEVHRGNPPAGALA